MPEGLNRHRLSCPLIIFRWSKPDIFGGSHLLSHAGENRAPKQSNRFERRRLGCVHRLENSKVFLLRSQYNFGRWTGSVVSDKGRSWSRWACITINWRRQKLIGSRDNSCEMYCRSRKSSCVWFDQRSEFTFDEQPADIERKDTKSGEKWVLGLVASRWNWL